MSKRKTVSDGEKRFMAQRERQQKKRCQAGVKQANNQKGPR
jgi:hypothetical protein